MPAELPVLGGIATKDLVEQIGTGSFKASYINWSRTMELLRRNAPGWMVEVEYNPDGEILHRAPTGAEIMLRFRHLDGTVTTSVPQAVMDNRNNSIPYDKITSRDITDTHRRGSCLLAAFHFGLAYELWAKMPLESGYQVADEETIQAAKARAESQEGAPTTRSKTKAAPPSPAPSAGPEAVSEKDFIAACSSKGLCEEAAKSLISKLNGNFENGIRTIAEKDQDFVDKLNAKFRASPGEDY
jgi:hypothetical protein